ncbi:MAG: hypothetical protein ACFFCW_08635 [Candidatus Hodarchaeota archaeon]
MKSSMIAAYPSPVYAAQTWFARENRTGGRRMMDGRLTFALDCKSCPYRRVECAASDNQRFAKLTQEKNR